MYTVPTWHKHIVGFRLPWAAFFATNNDYRPYFRLTDKQRRIAGFHRRPCEIRTNASACGGECY